MNIQKSNYSILIVDPSQIVADRIQQMLEELDCVEMVLKVFSGSEALAIMKKQPIDIVLLDTQLPGTDGFELLSSIKQSYPETKTIVLTNQSGNYYRHKGEKIGSDHFIDKSNEFEKIIQIINNYSLDLQMN